MKANNLRIGWLLIAFSLAGCVERYYPEDEDIFTGTLVVSGHLTDIPGVQTIRISRSDRLLYPEYMPEINCYVEVENDMGATIVFPEDAPGDYSAHLLSEFLVTGTSYRLKIVTFDGVEYESEYTRLGPSTEIDSVYYRVETRPSEEPGEYVEGLKFYMDYEIDPVSSPFMRWEIIETYEFHNPDYDFFIYDVDRVVKPVPDEMLDRTCWITLHINEIYTQDVGNVSSDLYREKPLHFVSTETQRLKYGYSLLVRQLSMEETAFRYWDELRKNSQESGGIYVRQPSFTPSNICNCADPEEKVLGYFSVSGTSEKRIFISEVDDLSFPERIFCFPTFEPPRLRWFLNADLPIFLAEAEWPLTRENIFGEVIRRCVDCRLHRGSVGEPPEFWQF